MSQPGFSCRSYIMMVSSESDRKLARDVVVEEKSSHQLVDMDNVGGDSSVDDLSVFLVE